MSQLSDTIGRVFQTGTGVRKDFKTATKKWTRWIAIALALWLIGGHWFLFGLVPVVKDWMQGHKTVTPKPSGWTVEQELTPGTCLVIPRSPNHTAVHYKVDEGGGWVTGSEARKILAEKVAKGVPRGTIWFRIQGDGAPIKYQIFDQGDKRC